MQTISEIRSYLTALEQTDPDEHAHLVLEVLAPILLLTPDATARALEHVEHSGRLGEVLAAIAQYRAESEQLDAQARADAAALAGQTAG